MSMITTQWNVDPIIKMLNVGIEVCHSFNDFKELSDKQKNNIRKQIKSLLLANRRHTRKYTSVEFFDRFHWTYRSCESILRTVYILGGGYFGANRPVQFDMQFQERWQIKKQRKNGTILDLDIWFKEIMNDVLRDEGMTLTSYEMEKARIEREAKDIIEYRRKKELVKKLEEREKIKVKKEIPIDKITEGEYKKKKTDRVKIISRTANQATGDVKKHVTEYLQKKGKENDNPQEYTSNEQDPCK